MTDIDRKRYVTIRQLAHKFREQGEDRSDNTIRRWVTEYPEFFKIAHIGGWLYVEYESALPVLKTIADSIGVGKNRGGYEVRDALVSKHAVVSASSDTSMLSEMVKVVGTDGEKVLVDFTPEAWEKLENMFKKGG